LAAILQQLLLVAKEQRANAGKSRSQLVNYLLLPVGIQGIMRTRLRPRSNEAHISLEDIENLWQFVDLGAAQKATAGQYTRIVRSSDQAAGHIGAVFIHGGKLVEFEVLSAFASSS